MKNNSRGYHPLRVGSRMAISLSTPICRGLRPKMCPSRCWAVTTAKPTPATHSPRPVSAPPTAPKSTPTPKSPTPPEDPAVIAVRRAARIAATQAGLKEIRERWPQTFSSDSVSVRPLARGIGQVIATQLPNRSKRLVHEAVAFWQRQRKTAYLGIAQHAEGKEMDGNTLKQATLPQNPGVSVP